MSKKPNLTRRRLIQGAAAVSASAALGRAGTKSSKAVPPMVTSGAVPHVLPELPYADDALAPHITPHTIGFHYGKHHAGYVKKLNAALEGSADADKSLEELITGGDAKYFNNAAQIWNHTFYWNSMRPGGGGAPGGKMADLIGASFGGYDEFREKFAKAAGGQFGSGWAWLVKDGDELAITTTANADTPIAHGGKPLITCDVWEHAYYLDYQNARGTYCAAFLDDLLNWEFAEANLG
jgi:Fe-Mn family superoxide dismutase